MMDENKRNEAAEDKFSAFDEPIRRTEKKANKGKMNKRKRTLLFTCAGALVLAAAVLVVTLLPAASTGGSSGDVSQVIDDPTITLLDKSVKEGVAVTKIEIVNEEDSFTVFYNEKDKIYRIQGYEDLTLESDGVATLTDCISAIYASQKVNDAADLSVFGLDDPIASITGTYHDNTSATLFIGDEVPSGGGYYVSLQERDGVYICATDTVSCFLAGATSYVDTTLLTAPVVKQDDSTGAPSLREVTLSGKTHPEPLTIRRRVDADGDEMLYYTYVISEPYKRGVSDEAANQLAAFYSLEASQAVVLHPTAEQLEKYGFTDPLTVMNLTLSVVSTVNNEEVEDGKEILEFYNTSKSTLTIGDKDESGNYLVMLDGVDAIFLVTAESLSAVAERTYDNTVTDLLYLKNILEVGRVDISTADGNHSFTLKHIKDEDDRDKSLVVTEGDKTYSTPEFRDLYQLMMSIERYDGLELAPDVDPVLGIDIYDVDGEMYLSADFYPASGSLYHVRTSEGELFVTRASNISHFIDQVSNLLNGKDVLIATG